MIEGGEEITREAGTMAIREDLTIDYLIMINKILTLRWIIG